MSHTDYTDFTDLISKLVNAMKQISQIATHRLRSRYHPDGSKGAATCLCEIREICVK